MIRKLFLSLLLLVLFGCSNDSFPLMQDEAEGSVTKLTMTHMVHMVLHMFH